MKTLLTFILILGYIVCNAQKTEIRLNKIPDGKWIWSKDSLEEMVVKGEYIIFYYNHKPIDTTQYFLSKRNYEKAYKPLNKKPLFLIWKDKDNLTTPNYICKCSYEIIVLTKDSINMILTANGINTPHTTFYKKGISN
jgi:hypothetical protein